MISANPSLPEPDAHIHFSSPQRLLDTQLSVFPRQAPEVGKPASSQDMLWIAGIRLYTLPGWSPDPPSPLTLLDPLTANLVTHGESWSER